MGTEAKIVKVCLLYLHLFQLPKSSEAASQLPAMLNKSRKKSSLSVFLGYQFEENLANDLWMKLLKLYNNYFRNYKARNFQEVQIVFQLPMANPSRIVVISGVFYQYKLRQKSFLILGPQHFVFKKLCVKDVFHLSLIHLFVPIFVICCFLFFFCLFFYLPSNFFQPRTCVLPYWQLRPYTSVRFWLEF